MTDTDKRPPKPETFTPPKRLMKIPAWAAQKAITNALQCTDGDSDRAEEAVRRVLAALNLATPEMPDTETTIWPDGTTHEDPISMSSLYKCGWGYLTPEGDIRMCALDEELADEGDESFVPGHQTPGVHRASAVTGDFALEFEEKDGRSFHAPDWTWGRGDRRAS